MLEMHLGGIVHDVPRRQVKVWWGMSDTEIVRCVIRYLGLAPDSMRGLVVERPLDGRLVVRLAG